MLTPEGDAPAGAALSDGELGDPSDDEPGARGCASGSGAAGWIGAAGGSGATGDNPDRSGFAGVPGAVERVLPPGVDTAGGGGALRAGAGGVGETGGDGDPAGGTVGPGGAGAGALGAGLWGGT